MILLVRTGFCKWWRPPKNHDVQVKSNVSPSYQNKHSPTMFLVILSTICWEILRKSLQAEKSLCPVSHGQSLSEMRLSMLCYVGRKRVHRRWKLSAPHRSTLIGGFHLMFTFFVCIGGVRKWHNFFLPAVYFGTVSPLLNAFPKIVVVVSRYVMISHI